jgi:hypothetical protein
MPAKKKTKKTRTRAKQTTKRAKPKASKKKSLKARTTGRKPVAAKTKRKPVAKKKVARQKIAKKKTVPKKKPKKAVAKKRRTELSEFSIKEPQAQSAQLSGDLQGLSHDQRSDSESVAELLEEGNTFEAEIVSGVEAADESEGEVESHQVPEDDVPGEYLDED